MKNSLIPVINPGWYGLGGILGGFGSHRRRFFSIPGVGRLMVSSMFGQELRCRSSYHFRYFRIYPGHEPAGRLILTAGLTPGSGTVRY